MVFKMSLKYVRTNGFLAPENAKSIEYPNYGVIFFSDENKRIIAYKKNNKVRPLHNLSFDGEKDFLNSLEKIKLEFQANSDVIAERSAEHNISKGDIFMVHHKLKEADHNVSFFQVTKLLDTNKVAIKELEKETIPMQNYNRSIPLPDLFVSDIELSVEVIANSFKTEMGDIAIKAAFKICNIGGLNLKVYDAISHGLIEQLD